MHAPDTPAPATPTAQPAPAVLPRLLSGWFAQYRPRVAIRLPAGSISYGTLDQRSTALANALGHQLPGTGPRTVAVSADNSVGFIVAVLGVIRAGMRLMIVDQSLAHDHIARMYALGQPQGAVRIGRGTDTVHTLVADRAGRLDQTWDHTPPAEAGDGGYLFFTSGTTGRPKAVEGRFDAAAHFVQWQRDAFRVPSQARFAQLTAPTFDVFLRDLLTPLSSGASLCLPPSHLRPGDPGILGWLERERITHLHTVPSVVASWLRGAGPGAALPALEHTFFAGEPLPRRLVERWRRIAPGTAVVNLYGPTETTLAKFAHKVEAGDGLGEHDPLPVGSPIPGAELLLLNEHGEPAAEGEAGEVVIKTALHARGYLGASEKETARFQTSPHAPGLVLYRTGDTGRLDGAGLLHLTGRVDRQVKIDGVRVEPDGVAVVLSGHPDVVRAAVEVREHHGRLRLVGYYVCEGELPAQELRDWLAGRMHGAHVPALLVRLDQIPLNANGKLDRARLHVSVPQPPPSPAQKSPSSLADRVQMVFSDVLGVRTDPDDDFLRCGGSSLTAAELAAAATKATERPVDYADVFEHRTPRRLAAALSARQSRSFEPIPTAPDQDGYPLSPQQRRYMRVYLPEGNRSWANMTAIFDDLPAGVDGEQVGRALREVLARHDSLRARFETDADGQLAQVFVPVPETVPVEEVELSGATPEKEAAQVQALVREEAARAIPIDTWPLFRVRLLRSPSGRSRVLWKVHHLVSDGQSQKLLGTELNRLLNDQGADLPPVTVRYRDYAAWRVEREKAALTRQRNYWQDVFTEPFDRPLLPVRGGPHRGAEGRAFQLPVSTTTRARLHDFAAERGLTPFSVILAAYMLACQELYCRNDMAVGTPAAGRGRSDVDTVIGNFISLVLIRHRTGEAQSFAELADLMQRRTALAMTHQDLQYDEVMEIAGAKPDGDRFPLTTAFISQVDALPGQAAALEVSGHRALGCEVKFDIMAYVKRSEERMAIDLQYRSQLLSDADAASFVEGVRSRLDTGLADPDAPWGSK